MAAGGVLIRGGGGTGGVPGGEPYLLPGTKVEGAKSVLLDKNEYFVMGDNRAGSLDSRYFGAVNRGFITGRVILRGWPLNRVNVFFEPPAYNVP